MSNSNVYRFFMNCLDFEDEPIDNYLGIILIWFLIGVIMLLVVGVVFLVILSRVQDEDASDECCDEEKQEAAGFAA